MKCLPRPPFAAEYFIFIVSKDSIQYAVNPHMYGNKMLGHIHMTLHMSQFGGLPKSISEQGTEQYKWMKFCCKLQTSSITALLDH